VNAGEPFVPLARGQVLVVEDHDDSRRLLEDLLVAAGFEVYTASNGPEALRFLEHFTPDLMVLDLMLPWINGIEVLATIRERPALAKLPVLVTTATATTDEELREFQPLEVMRKPIELEAVVPAIEHLFARHLQTSDPRPIVPAADRQKT
jgi:CheY-like chemotaxis protein